MRSSCWTSERSLLNRMLSVPLLRRFGKYSYAIYILHPLIRWLIQPSYVRYGRLVMGSSLPGFLVYLLVAIALCLLAGWLSWHGIEKHFLALKRFFPSRGEAIEAPAAPVPAPAVNTATTG